MEFQSYLPRLFLGVSGVAFLSCLSRSDYNLPLFLYAWLIWFEGNKNQRIPVIFLLCVTLFVDIAWILYWGSAWNSANDDSWMNMIHHIVYVLSILEILLKIPTVGIAFLSEKENLIDNLPESLSKIFIKS